ncbi:MAG: hypothetical protein Q6K99_09045 [Thermostichales cyanobacterium BF4_bins_65]
MFALGRFLPRVSYLSLPLPRRTAWPSLLPWLRSAKKWQLVVAVILAGTLLTGIPKSGQAEVVVWKEGQYQAFPLLQTRARPPVPVATTLYLGMLQQHFLLYATDNNWQTLRVVRHGIDASRWDLLPGGEAVYSSYGSDLRPTYARGFWVRAYFDQQRLVGMQLVRDPREPGFSVAQLQRLVQGWFPDHALVLWFQVLPEDQSQQVLLAYLGEVPAAFERDLLPTLNVPFCQALLVPGRTTTVPDCQAS